MLMLFDVVNNDIIDIDIDIDVDMKHLCSGWLVSTCT